MKLNIAAQLFTIGVSQALSGFETGEHYNGTANNSYAITDIDDRSHTVIFQNQVEAQAQNELGYLRQYYNNPNHTTYNLIFQSVTRNEMKHNIFYQLDMEKPPDVIGWYAGGEVTRKLIEKEHTHDLHDFFTEYGLYDVLPQSMLQGVSDENGHPHAMPTDMYHWGVHYDTRTFTRLGLTPPTTWAEFLNVCKVLKNDGLIPITIGTQWLWPLGGWIDYLNMRINGPEFHVKVCAGEIPFTDPRIHAVFEEWKNLIDLGYFPTFEDHSTNTWWKMVTDLSEQKAGMALMGDFLRWNMEESIRDHYDWFKFPEIVPGIPSGEDAPTDGYLIPAKAVNKKGAYEFLSHLISTDIQKQRLATTTISANAAANSVIVDPKILRGAQMLKDADFIVQFYDRDTDPAFASLGMQMMREFTGKPEAYPELLADLEIKRREHYLGLAPQPEITPNGAKFNQPVWVNITTTLEGGVIYYTTDESMPTEDSLKYEGAIELATHGRFVIRAVVTKEGLKKSPVAQQVFTLDLKTEVTIGTAAASLGTYLSAISMVVSLVLMCFIHVHRKSPAVRATSPSFVITMLIGVVITLATGIVSSVGATGTACTIQVWTISVGWALTFGSLLAKTYRVIAIFGNTSLSKKRIQNSQLVQIVIGVLVIEVCICLAWTFAGPLAYTKMEDDVHFWYVCYGENFEIFMIASLLPKILMLALAVVVSIKTRNYVAAFNESKTIGFAVYNLAFIGGSSFALSMVMKELGIAHIVRMIGLNSTCMILACAIAAKPLFIVYFRPHLNSEKSWFQGSSSANTNKQTGVRVAPTTVTGTQQTT